MKDCTRILPALLLLVLAACQAPGPVSAPGPDEARTRPLEAARHWQRLATLQATGSGALRSWLQCAAHAYVAIDASQAEAQRSAAVLATRCSGEFLALAIGRHGKWSQGHARISGVQLEVDLRRLSPDLQSPLDLSLASEVSMAAYDGERHATPGFGVALAVTSPRCRDHPRCSLQPPEGVNRGATAWIEFDGAAGGLPRLVLVDPLIAPEVSIHGHRLRLALDTSAPWARLGSRSHLPSLALLGLIGGDAITQRAGLYLLEDYDPRKQPIIMIHGLGSSPLIWAHLSNAIWGDPQLRARFQIWHVVYQSNAPLLILRLRVQKYLDEAWRLLDPEGDDPARRSMTLVGHSLGGVISRLLSADSGELLWDAAFRVPPDALRADDYMRAELSNTFRFSSYPGIARAIFIAVPHRGSPSASAWVGRVMGRLVGRRVPEIRSLQKIARANPDAVQPALRDAYLSGWVNSIFTLRQAQPVRKAGESLMPRNGIPYHTIAGSLRGRTPGTDGVVPLDSALLDGAASTLVVEAGHDLYRHPATVGEVLRILRESISAH